MIHPWCCATPAPRRSTLWTGKRRSASPLAKGVAQTCFLRFFAVPEETNRRPQRPGSAVPKLGKSQGPAQGDSPGQQDAESQEQKARLMEAKAPQQLTGLV